LPIKDKGLNAFIGNWAAKVLPMDFWVGLRALTTYRKYDPKATEPLIEKIVNGVFSYSDGTIFDVVKGKVQISCTKLPYVKFLASLPSSTPSYKAPHSFFL